MHGRGGQWRNAVEGSEGALHRLIHVLASGVSNCELFGVASGLIGYGSASTD